MSDGSPFSSDKSASSPTPDATGSRRLEGPSSLDQPVRKFSLTTSPCSPAKRISHPLRLLQINVPRALLQQLPRAKLSLSIKDRRNHCSLPASSLEAKCQVFAKNLFLNTSKIKDIQADCPTVNQTRLPSPDLTLVEIKDSILIATSTAPGEDEIMIKLLKICWALIETVFRLFQEFLDDGEHPAYFKTAVVVILNKLNKTDKIHPQSYRPIAVTVLKQIVIHKVFRAIDEINLK
ncbi:reverse transcriptase, putative, partial [Golovinomyces cichoracearum]